MDYLITNKAYGILLFIMAIWLMNFDFKKRLPRFHMVNIVKFIGTLLLLISGLLVFQFTRTVMTSINELSNRLFLFMLGGSIVVYIILYLQMMKKSRARSIKVMKHLPIMTIAVIWLSSCIFVIYNQGQAQHQDAIAVQEVSWLKR